MAFRLRIFFSGLCVFVPIEKDGKIVEVQVLFPNADGEERIKAVTGTNFLKPHKTFLQFRYENRISQIPSYPFFFDAENRLNGLWELKGENLEILAPGSRNPLNIRVEMLKRVIAANHGPEMPSVYGRGSRDFYWVSPLRDDQGNLAEIRQDLLADPLDVPDTIKDLRARMVIRNGKLSPTAFSADGGKKEFFIYKVGNQFQTIATVVELRLDIEGDRAMFQARKFQSAQTNDPPFTRRLMLGPEPGEEEIEVWVLNREYDEVTRQQPIPESQHNLRQKQEFLFYKTLLEGSVPCNAPSLAINRAKKGDADFFNINVRNTAMRRLYFPTFDGEGGNVGGPCSPVTSNIKKS